MQLWHSRPLIPCPACPASTVCTCLRETSVHTAGGCQLHSRIVHRDLPDVVAISAKCWCQGRRMDRSFGFSIKLRIHTCRKKRKLPPPPPPMLKKNSDAFGAKSGPNVVQTSTTFWTFSGHGGLGMGGQV